MRALKVKENKLTSRNDFIVNLFALESESESAFDQKTLYWDSSQILDLSLNP